MFSWRFGFWLFGAVALGVGLVTLFTRIDEEPVTQLPGKGSADSTSGNMLYFVLMLGFGSLSVKLVSWIIKEHEARMVYLVQGGLISVVIVGILAICWVSRGKSFRNG